MVDLWEQVEHLTREYERIRKILYRYEKAHQFEEIEDE